MWPPGSAWVLWSHSTCGSKLEAWPPDGWAADDANTDVMVAFSDGARWAATFFTYANILSLAKKNQQTGEQLAGAWFWYADMIFIDRLSRPRIGAVVRELLRSGELTRAFMRLSPADDHAE